MAQVNKTLAQLAPTALTETTLYTCPALSYVTPFPMKIYNNGTSIATWYVRHRLLGAATDPKQIADGGKTLNPDETIYVKLLPLSPTDIITVYSSTGTVVFQLAGQENT